ncbi:MAG TPA: DNA repair protein RecO [Longimicrobiales bacterium]|nr:DNA repair protein RecO [Longimicrobiales bacterium]
MALLPTDAIVLQSFPYGDTSRIVRLLTRGAGVQSAIAKGAARPRSRYSTLEPFAEGVAALYIRDSRDLQTLGGFDLTRSRQDLGRDLVRFGSASLVAELVIRTGSEQPQPELFDAVAAGLDRLVAADRDAVETAALAAVWHVIATLGFAPELDACIACGAVVDAAAAASFDYGAGGVRCTSCAAGLPGRLLPPHARAALAGFNRGHAVHAPVTEGHWRLLTRYLEHHILEGSPLRSLQFLVTSLHAG